MATTTSLAVLVALALAACSRPQVIRPRPGANLNPFASPTPGASASPAPGMPGASASPAPGTPEAIAAPAPPPSATTPAAPSGPRPGPARTGAATQPAAGGTAPAATPPTGTQTSPATPEPSPPSPPSPPAQLPGSPAPSPFPSRSPRPQSWNIELPGGGPTENIVPPGDDPYTLLSRGQCREALAMTEGWSTDPANDFSVGAEAFLVYHAAAAACRSDWETFDREYPAITPSSQVACAMASTVKWLQGIKAIRDANPGVTLRMVRSSRLNSDCPVGLLPSPAGGIDPADPYHLLSGDPDQCASVLGITEHWNDDPSHTPLTERDHRLYHAAGAACSNRWQTVMDDFKAVKASGPASSLTCIQRAVYEWLNTLVRSKPKPDTTLTFERNGSDLECP